MRKWIRGGKLITPDQTLTDRVIIIEAGRVAALEPQAEVITHPAETDVIDASGLLVLPGFIDLHVHGGAGSDVMDATSQGLDQMAVFFLAHGVTAYLPTTGAVSREAIDRVLDTILRYTPAGARARPLGVHLEGPYLDYTYRGAQPVEWLRDPQPAEYRPWFDTGLVRLMAVAPELPGALEMIREGVSRGIRFSAGHTAASFDQVEKAADEGLSQSTHTFNGMSGLHHREPGAAGAVLSDERIYCEVICDGNHVHPAVLRLLVRAKGIERTIIVSDAIRAAGLEDGKYDVVGQTISVTNGVARTGAGGLAGSTITINQSVRNMMLFAGLSINEAVALATSTPAAAMGLSGIKGAICPGADADIIFMDPDFNVRAAMIAGEMVYSIQPN